MKPNSLPVLAIIFSLLFWFLDSMIDSVFFDKDQSIVAHITQPESAELWMRLVVVSLLVSFSIYAKSLLNKQIKISNELEENRNRLEAIAITDPLTQLFNRRKFSEMLQFEIGRERRYKNGLFFMVCDIDKFKDINDEYGHIVGDEVLKMIAKLLKDSTRETDIVARWGGEEFVLLITNTDVSFAPIIANKLRKLIEITKFRNVGGVTASFGIAYYQENDDEESLFARADKALYQAKNNGRNCVAVSTGDEHASSQIS